MNDKTVIHGDSVPVGQRLARLVALCAVAVLVVLPLAAPVAQQPGASAAA